MPHSIDLGDLVQDGVIGLIDAANRFDEGRGIKFETFAERRVRGAMIDALRRDAWPRGVRRVRRELEAAREQLRRELGAEPSLADLAKRVGADVQRLERTIVRITTIESTSPMANLETIDSSTLPAVLVPSEPLSPHRLFEQAEMRDRVRQRSQMLARARAADHHPLLLRRSDDEADWTLRLASTNRASRNCTRGAISRLKQALVSGSTARPAAPASEDRAATRSVRSRRHAWRRSGRAASRRDQTARLPGHDGACVRSPSPAFPCATRTRSRSRNGFAIQRHPLSSRNRSASDPATSPVTKTSRRAMFGIDLETSAKNAMPSTFGIFKSQMITS